MASALTRIKPPFLFLKTFVRYRSGQSRTWEETGSPFFKTPERNDVDCVDNWDQLGSLWNRSIQMNELEESKSYKAHPEGKEGINKHEELEKAGKDVRRRGEDIGTFRPSKVERGLEQATEKATEKAIDEATEKATAKATAKETAKAAENLRKKVERMKRRGTWAALLAGHISDNPNFIQTFDPEKQDPQITELVERLRMERLERYHRIKRKEQEIKEKKALKRGLNPDSPDEQSFDEPKRTNGNHKSKRR